MAKFYIDWQTREVLTEREREQYIENKVIEITDDEEELESFLDRECTLTELFNMSQQEREELQERFRAWAEVQAEEAVEEELNEYDTTYYE